MAKGPRMGKEELESRGGGGGRLESRVCLWDGVGLGCR